jgi:hypothetical protein
MQDLKLNPTYAGAVSTAGRSTWLVQSLFPENREDPKFSTGAQPGSSFTRLVLAIETLSGCMLVGIAVAVLIADFLISGSLLLRGPMFIFELMARVSL